MSELAQVRIQVPKERPRDTEIIVNNRALQGLVRSYQIAHSCDGDSPLPTVTLELSPINGILYEAAEARLQVNSACTFCGFTHRQALLPISETDYAQLEEALLALQNPIIGNLEEAGKYVESLLRDVRASLDAFNPATGEVVEHYGEGTIRTASAQLEERTGEPKANSTTSPSGVDFAREALASERRRANEEGSSDSGDQADVGGSGPSGEGDRASQGGVEGVRADEPATEGKAVKVAAHEWPSIEGEDPED